MKRIDLRDLGRRYGIHFMAQDGADIQSLLVMDAAQPGLVTAPNSGIPSLFTTYVDPKLLEVYVSPVKAADLYGETKKGTWVSDTAMFLVVERTGETSSYSDYSQDGMSNANANFPQRQSYHYQTQVRWGERELARAAEAKIDWANRVNMGAALTMLKFQNQAYLYGIDGLANYGGTNDPSLPAPIAPTANWYNSDGGVVYGDMLRLVQRAIQLADGLLDAESKFRLGISPGNVTNMNKTTEFNVNVFDQVKKNFPNLTIVTVPEFAINGGGSVPGGTELIQLIPESIEGAQICEAAFTEKMRAHAMIQAVSTSWEQKKSSGTWGVVYYYPGFVAQMLG